MRRQKVRRVGNINALLLWCTEHRPFSFLKGMVLTWAFDQFSNTVGNSLVLNLPFVLSPFHLNSCCMILLGTWLRSEAGRSWAYIHWSQLMFDCITGLAWWQPLMLASCKQLWQWVPSHQRKKVRGLGNINALLLWCTDHGPFWSQGWVFDQFSNTVWNLQWHCQILLISI